MTTRADRGGGSAVAAIETPKKEKHGRTYLLQLQQWLSHQSLDTTQIYVHMGRKNARKAMDATSL